MSKRTVVEISFPYRKQVCELCEDMLETAGVCESPAEGTRDKQNDPVVRQMWSVAEEETRDGVSCGKMHECKESAGARDTMLHVRAGFQNQQGVIATHESGPYGRVCGPGGGTQGEAAGPG